MTTEEVARSWWNSAKRAPDGRRQHALWPDTERGTACHGRDMPAEAKGLDAGLCKTKWGWKITRCTSAKATGPFVAAIPSSCASTSM